MTTNKKTGKKASAPAQGTQQADMRGQHVAEGQRLDGCTSYTGQEAGRHKLLEWPASQPAGRTALHHTAQPAATHRRWPRPPWPPAPQFSPPSSSRSPGTAACRVAPCSGPSSAPPPAGEALQGRAAASGWHLAAERWDVRRRVQAMPHTLTHQSACRARHQDEWSGPKAPTCASASRLSSGCTPGTPMSVGRSTNPSACSGEAWQRETARHASARAVPLVSLLAPPHVQHRLVA